MARRGGHKDGREPFAGFADERGAGLVESMPGMTDGISSVRIQRERPLSL
jgi:hypothetical protein